MKIHAVMMLALTMFSSGGYGQDKFVSLWRFAAENNPSITAEKMQLKALEEEAKASGLLPDPALEIEMMSIDPSGLRSNRGYSAGISQVIPSKGKLSLEKELAKAKIELQKAVIREKEYSLGIEISEIFWEAQLLRKRSEINEKRLSSIRAIKGSALELYSSGSINLVDLLRIEEQITRLSAESRELAYESGVKKNELFGLTGKDVPRELTEEEGFEDGGVNYTDADIFDMLELSPAVAEAKQKARLAEIEEGIARKAKNPDLMIKGVYKIDDPVMNGKDSISLMMGITMPFLRKKSRYAPLVEKAVYEKKRDEEMVDYEKVRLQSVIMSIKEELKKDEEQARSYERLEIQAESAFQSALSMYSAGRGDLSTLFETIDDYYSAQEMLYGAQAGISSARARLRCSLGTIEGREGE